MMMLSNWLNHVRRFSLKRVPAPRISVVMPVYNDRLYIAEAVESLLRQTYTHFEILALVEYGASDECISYLRSISDKRLKVVLNPSHYGLAKTLNLGITMARGEYIARMDADDISEPQRFEMQLKFLDEHDEIDMCGTFCHVFGAENWEFRPAESDALLKVELLVGCPFIHPSVMFRRKSMIDNELRYSESIGATEDYELWARAFGMLHFANVPEFLVKYRKHLNTATSSNRHEGEVIYRDVMRKLLSQILPVSDSDIDLHYKCFTSGPKSAEELIRLRDWLQRVIDANDIGEIHRQHDLQGVLAWRFFGLCRNLGNMEAYYIAKSARFIAPIDDASFIAFYKK